MNTTDLITTTRESAGIGDAAAYIDYTDARMLRELNDKLATVFEDIVTKSRSGYWLQSTTQNTVAGRALYRIPARAVVGGLETIEIATSSGGALYEIPQIPAADVGFYEGQPGRTGQPVVYAVLGDQVKLIPAPSSAVSLRMYYYIRPSQLVPQQSSSTGGTVRGRVTAVDTTLRTVTVAVLPFDQSLAVPAAIQSGQAVDIVHRDGWHELSMVSAVCTVAGGGPYTITLGTSTISGANEDMNRIEVGDYVRAADQTDWPCLPDDFHRCLCDATAVKILIELHLSEKSDMLAANNGNDLVRFKSLLYPRVKASPKQVGIMRRSRGGPFPYGRFYG